MNRLSVDEKLLVIEHLYVAERVAAKLYAPDPFDNDDVFQLATEALIRCAQTFDSNFGVPFEAYAQQRVKWWTIRECEKLQWGGAWSTERVGELVPLTESLLSPEDPTSGEVNAFLDTLSPKRRQVVVLRMMGYTHDEIGAMNGNDESASRMLIKRLAEELDYP